MQGMLAGGYHFRFLHRPCVIEIAEGFRQETQNQLPSMNAYSFSKSLDVFRDKYPVMNTSVRENNVDQASYDAVEKGANGFLLLPAKILPAQPSHSFIRELTSASCQSPLEDTQSREYYHENVRLRRTTSCPQLGRICTRFTVEILEEAYLREQTELNWVSLDVCEDRLVLTAMGSLEEYRQLEWSMEMLIAYPEECSYLCQDLGV